MQYSADSGPTAVALVAATAKTCLMVMAPASIGGQLIEISVTFDGVTASNTPVLLELVKSSNASNSTPGTGNTSVTPVQTRGDGNTSGTGLAALFTAFAASTSEPTVLTVAKRWLVPPTSGLLYQGPLGREAAIVPSMGLGLRITAPQAVNVRCGMEFIQGPSWVLVANQVAPAALAGATYDSTVLADSPLSFWKCAEAGTTTLADSGTGANPLTLGGSYALGAAGIGDSETALQFTGNSLTTNGTATPAQTLSGTFTLELWVNLASTASGFELFATRSPTDFGMDVQANGTAGFHADIGTGAAWLSTAANLNATITTGTWYHVVYVVTPTGYQTYLQGAAKDTGTWASATPLLWDANHHIYLGGSPQTSSALATVAKLAAYSKALTAAQVLAHYQAQLLAGAGTRAAGTAPVAAQALARASLI